jgi:opacity protein-like surface antigen
MKKYQYILVLAAVCLSFYSKAQVSTFGFNYVIGTPMGNTKDFIDLASYRGASFEYTYVPDDHIGVHFEAGWNNFYQKVEGTFEHKTLSVTGVQYRYVESVPLLVGINYFILPEAIVKPYVAFGMGLVYTEKRDEIGLYSLSFDSWQFAIKPEIGAAVSLSDNTLLKLSAKYYQTFETKKLESLPFLGLNIGLAFKVE